jgi:hypothetical protein
MRELPMLRLSIALTCAGLATIMGAETASSLPSRASTVTIAVDRATEVFRGRVISRSPGCYRDREVQVLRVRQGRDLYITRTFTDQAGRWRAIIPAQHARRLYARVRPHTVAPNGVARARCAGDRSRVILG